MSTSTKRRELKTRSSSLAQKIAHLLSKKNITPNHILLFSIIFAAAAAFCLYFITQNN
ncbi:MAG: CDP-alcohol phosphatidyltransferase family protein, partial [Lentisphaeraceae bacterium]|nr:CDP-alcohol phosphatidyltransferase family protein [Lentisphaeraceae bacterium]